MHSLLDGEGVRVPRFICSWILRLNAGSEEIDKVSPSGVDGVARGFWKVTRRSERTWRPSARAWWT